jgi:hypothetical protein
MDVSIQIALGRFFAEKLRAAVAYTMARQTGDTHSLESALDHYRAARDAWAAAAREAEGIYVDDLVFGPEPPLRGHWSDRLDAIDQDIQDMQAALARLRAEPRSGGQPRLDPADADTNAWRDAYVYAHTPPPAFERGQPVTVQLEVRPSTSGAEPGGIAVWLRYRHVDQAEGYQEAEMRAEGARYQVVIPGDYTDSPYPLQYFFRLEDASGRAWLYPGFDADLANQPYFVVRQASAAPA